MKKVKRKNSLWLIVLVILLLIALAFGFFLLNRPAESLAENKVQKEEKTEDQKDVSTSDTSSSQMDQRIEAYKKDHPDISDEEAEKRVAMNLDLEPYENYTVIENPQSITMLVNKYNKLPDQYVPNDLTDIVSNGENGTVQMKKEAAEAFNALSQLAADNGITLNACSSFRDQNYQDNLYSNGAEVYGQEYADQYWTRPGFSEHQSGLSVDIRLENDTSDLDAVLNYPEKYQWLLNNMADYGFIVRYPENKEQYTLIAPESWHLRYVGKDLAHYLQKNNLAMDEYYGLLALGKAENYLKN